MDDVGILLVAVALAAVLRVMWQRCLLTQCRWVWRHNAMIFDDTPCGVYQCVRCKTVSVGAWRDAPWACVDTSPTPESTGSEKP